MILYLGVWGSWFRGSGVLRLLAVVLGMYRSSKTF